MSYDKDQRRQRWNRKRRSKRKSRERTHYRSQKRFSPVQRDDYQDDFITEDDYEGYEVQALAQERELYLDSDSDMEYND
jgi:hypothetical protein